MESETTGEDFRFEGFGTPEYTNVPDVLFDVLMPRLTDIELRVLLYIVRRTFGFKKGADDISLRQMVEGITTRDGRVLDGGCGLSRPSVTKAVRGLVEKRIITATQNYSEIRGNEATTYTLVFAQALPQPRDERGEVTPLRGGRNGVTTQETEEQETEEQGNFEASKAPPAKKFVDNSRSNAPKNNAPSIVSPDDTASLPPRYQRRRADLPAHVMIPLTRLMEDLSRDLNDMEHVTSNISRAANLYAEYATDVDRFFVTAYEARTFARHQVNARSRMALFFTALERDLKGTVGGNEGDERQEPRKRDVM